LYRRGKGLGKEENGVTEAVKVKRREENAGIGLDSTEKFDDQWWHDVYNKASRTDIATAADEQATETKKSKKERKEAKKRKKAGLARIGEVPTDEQLLAACGGRRMAMRARADQKGKWKRTADLLIDEDDANHSVVYGKGGLGSHGTDVEAKKTKEEKKKAKEEKKAAKNAAKAEKVAKKAEKAAKKAAKSGTGPADIPDRQGQKDKKRGKKRGRDDDGEGEGEETKKKKKKKK
jgi:hypothetical protein